jgi:hypothetical protein
MCCIQWGLGLENGTQPCLLLPSFACCAPGPTDIVLAQDYKPPAGKRLMTPIYESTHFDEVALWFLTSNSLTTCWTLATEDATFSAWSRLDCEFTFPFNVTT